MTLHSHFSKLGAVAGCIFAAIFSSAALGADDDDAPVSGASSSTRYGLFNGLDHRSSYGLDVFPEPFLVDDSNKEQDEARLDWFSSRASGHQQNNVITAELEKGFGNLTLQLGLPFEIDKAPGQSTRGWGNIEAGARYPLFEAVALGGGADTTFGVATEAGIPLNTVFSKNAELIPEIFNDTRLGNFTVQAVFGYSMLFGAGGEDGGLHTFEYGFTLGYAMEKPCRGVEQIIPNFELSGEKALHKDEAGRNSITASAGLRADLKVFGTWMPHLGIGYVFPMNNAALSDLHNGVYTSLVFEF
jgi:hypothetical protein